MTISRRRSGGEARCRNLVDGGVYLATIHRRVIAFVLAPLLRYARESFHER